MRERDGMRVKHKILKTENAMPAILFVLLLIYLAGIIWVNSNGELWYNLDMYYDAAIARCMVEQKNIFPQDWVFGNQTYVIATPVLAAFFYYIFHDTVLALSLASSMMTLLVLWAFCWCIRPFVRGSSLLAGALCLMGGTLFSRNAATDIQGLQLLLQWQAIMHAIFWESWLRWDYGFAWDRGKKSAECF